MQAEPANGEAWAWIAAIHLVRADYAAAMRGCDGLAPLTTPLLAAGCRAAVDSLTGNAEAAETMLAAP